MSAFSPTRQAIDRSREIAKRALNLFELSIANAIGFAFNANGTVISG